MARRDHLRPGQPVDRLAFNALADKLDRRVKSAVGIAIQDGAAGMSLVPDRTIQPVWGEITGDAPVDPDDPTQGNRRPNYWFQWREVIPLGGKWLRTEDQPGYHSGYGSDVHETYGGGIGGDDNKAAMMHPAIEMGSHDVRIGEIVRLIPSLIYVDESIKDNEGNPVSHRAWMFSWDELRPFVVTEDLIPTGGGELDTTVSGQWLDVTSDAENVSHHVQLYPAHKTGPTGPDNYISLGIGRPQTMYFRGTYGWAKYVPHGTQTGVDDDNDPVWRGEWQIVTLYAETIARAFVTGGDPLDGSGLFGGGDWHAIQPDEKGKAYLFWMDNQQNPPKLMNSGYLIDLQNTLSVPLDPSDQMAIGFSRDHYLWYPLSEPLGHGITLRMSAAMSATTTWKTVPLDVVMDKSQYGMFVNHSASVLGGAKNMILNSSETPKLGIASWSVTGERDLTGAPAIDVDSGLQVGLFVVKEGIPSLWTGTTSEMTSSRRRVGADEEGHFAKNSNSGSIVIELPAGQGLQVKVRVVHEAEADDTWKVTSGSSHLTFHTIPGTPLREEEE